MASDESIESRSVIEHGSTRAGRWLHARRSAIALWIAVVEGVIVALAHDFSRWTVIAIAIPVLALYVFWGATRDPTPRARSPGSPPPRRRWRSSW